MSRAERFIGPGLILLVAAVFGRVAGHDFIDYDDIQYVYGNPLVVGGLTLHGVRWALTATWASNWHPLTWLSHMLDVSLFGLTPGAHHLVSVVIHAGTTVALHALLRRLTGAPWRAAIVAALFAVHPLHVESVAWVAERKDVLCGLGFVLTIAAWVRWAERPSAPRYVLAGTAFALTLSAKPMAVTLPFVLLLLDWWPLDRLRAGAVTWRRAVVEKTPFFVLSVAASVVTYAAQWDSRGVLAVPLASRVANALASYASYLGKTAAPVGLAVYYPHPAVIGEAVPAIQVVTGAAVLILVSAAAIVLRHRRPYLVVGWLWYVGMLVPVIGLVQVGKAAMADRYTYLPLIGIFVAVVWGIADAVRRWDPRGAGGGLSATVILATYAVLAWVQVGHWRHPGTLYAHALTVTPRSIVAWNNLGSYLKDLGRVPASVTAFREAVRIKPDYARAWYNLGAAYATLGDWPAAIEAYRRALSLEPHQDGFTALGAVYERAANVPAAIAAYRAALQMRPRDAFAMEQLRRLGALPPAASPAGGAR